MTTLSRQYKLPKNILFYILQRHGSEPGKMAANLRRGLESGGGGHAFEYDKQRKDHFVSEHFFAIMLNIETFLNCCQKQGDQVPPTATPLCWNINLNYTLICII